MAISNRYLLNQIPVMTSLARTAMLASRGVSSGAPPPVIPGPELQISVPPRPADMVRDYARWTGGVASSYKRQLPPHLFPQWVFPFQARSLEGLPYPLMKVLNAGCTVQVKGPLPIDEELSIRTQLVGLDDDGRRAILTQRTVTETVSSPEALIVENRVLVPLGSAKSKGEAKRKPKPRVPLDAREVAFHKLRVDAGRDFAKLTGDINPIHWIPLAAKASGFRNVILHGFATMALAWEAVVGAIYSGDVSAIQDFDVRFTRPLVLPARVGVYVEGKSVFVGDAPGGPAYLVGRFNDPHRSDS